VDKVALVQDFLRVLRLSAVSIISPWMSMLIHQLDDGQQARCWPQFRDIVSPPSTRTPSSGHVVGLLFYVSPMLANVTDFITFTFYVTKNKGWIRDMLPCLRASPTCCSSRSWQCHTHKAVVEPWTEITKIRGRDEIDDTATNLCA
jgi:hypothetical protein